MAQIGLQELYYSKLTKDDTTGVTYETPKKIAGAIQVDINPTINTNTLYADDAPFATASSLSEIEVTIEMAQIPQEDLAIILGHTIGSDGVMKYSKNDEAPYVQILAQSKKHDGNIRYFRLMKGKFADTQETINTKGENLEYQTPSIQGTFVCREYDGLWKSVADSDNTDAAAAITGWYSQVD